MDFYAQSKNSIVCSNYETYFFYLIFILNLRIELCVLIMSRIFLFRFFLFDLVTLFQSDPEFV